MDNLGIITVPVSRQIIRRTSERIESLPADEAERQIAVFYDLLQILYGHIINNRPVAAGIGIFQIVIA